jgi:6-carboxyhexanoate--CoA ligase
MSVSDLFSVRMRATAGGRHLSGAERIVRPPRLAETVQKLLDRAHGKNVAADHVVMTIDAIPAEQVRSIGALDLVAAEAPDVPACQRAARWALERAGVSAAAVSAAMDALDRGPAASGGNMRGAMVMDARTGDRLEPDQERGIRASRFDWGDDAAGMVDRALTSLKLIHVRTNEALALASKVARAPGIIAELGWSDDPDYTAGYAAGPAFGYLRFPFMKQPGVPRGGRAFFVERSSWDLQTFRTYLEDVPVVIVTVGTFRTAAICDLDTIFTPGPPACSNRN